MQNEKRNYEVIIDRYGQTDYLTPIFHQFDTETAKLMFRFLSNGSPWNIPYTRLVLIIQKPDQKEVYQEIESFRGNTAEVILKNQALTVAGELNCQIKMYKNEILESTWSFKIKVKPSIGNDEAIKSENDYGVLHQLIKDVDHNIEKNNQTVNDLVEGTTQVVSENIEKNKQAIQDLVNEAQESVSESIRQTTESMNQNIQANNQAVMDALAQIDKSELVRLKELIELLQQNKLGITDKASDSALLNGVVEDVEATSNTIVKRTPDGVIHAKSFVQDQSTYGTHPIEMGKYADMHQPGSINDVDVRLEAILQRGLMIRPGNDLSQGTEIGRINNNASFIKNEKGGQFLIMEDGGRLTYDGATVPHNWRQSFTPFIYSENATWATSSAVGQATYLGDLIYIQGRVIADKGGADGKVCIGGLPQASVYNYPAVTIGFFGGVTSSMNSLTYGVNGYIQAGSSNIFLNFTLRDANWQQLGTVHVGTRIDVCFSALYRWR